MRNLSWPPTERYTSVKGIVAALIVVAILGALSLWIITRPTPYSKCRAALPSLAPGQAWVDDPCFGVQ
jgi:hypothetical protein